MSSNSSSFKNILEFSFKSKEEAHKAASAFRSTIPLLQASQYKDNVVLITGANKGLGYETARQLGAKGFKVILACRDSERGKAAQQKLQEQDKTATFQFVQLDVSSTASITAAVETIRGMHGHLDVLINNAGVTVDFAQPSQVDAEAIRKTFETNMIGPMLMIKAFLPLLEKSTNARIVNVSSALGSNEAHCFPSGAHVQFNLVGYCASKAALNLYTVLAANEQLAKKSNMRVNAICPGYTATDMSNNTGIQTVAEGAEAIVTASITAPDGPTGAFFNRFSYLSW